MASGTINGSGSKVALKISWSSAKGNGGSTVSATLYAVNNSYYYFHATLNQGYNLTINGNKKTGSTASLSSAVNGTATLLSHSVWVSYTGDKSITISGYADMTNINANGNLGTRSVSGTATLDKIGSIPSTPTCSAPTTKYFSEKGGSITISWTKSTSYNNSGGYYVDVQVNSGAWTNIKKITNLSTLSTTYNIPAGQGGTYRFRVTSYNDIGNASSYSYSGTVTRNSLKPPIIGTIGLFNPWLQSTLSVPLSGGSQANGSAFKRCASIYTDGSLLYSCTTPANGNTTASIPVNAQTMTNKLGSKEYASSKKFSVVAWTENANGSRSNYVSTDLWVNINTDGGAYPTISAPRFSGGTLGNTASCFIAGISNLIVTSATGVLRRAASGTTLSYKIECTGASTKSGTSATFTGLTAGVKTVTVTVTDSRGLSARVSKQCVFQTWAKPTVKISSCDRDTGTGTTAKLSYSISYSPIYQYTTADNKGNQLNSITTQQYKLNSGSWTTATNGMTLSGLSTEMTYNLTVRAIDKANPSSYGSAGATIPTTKPIMALRKNGVGIGCVPASAYSLDVSGDVRITNGGLVLTAYGSTKKAIEPSGGDSTGMGLKIGGGGGILLASGESGSLFTVNQSEYLYITSDGQINFYTNCNNGLDGAHRTYISAAGHLYCDGNIQATGTISGSNVSVATISATTVKATTITASKIQGAVQVSGMGGDGYGQFRAIAGNYGCFIRNDGTNTYFLLTNSGNQYGTWNSLRPFTINNAGGGVTMSNGVAISGGLTTNTITTSGNHTINGKLFVKTAGSWIGYNQFTTGWMGFYNSYGGTRKAWIGHSTGVNLVLKNESSNIIELRNNVYVGGGGVLLTSTGSSRSISATWSDGAQHDIISIASDNRTTYIGAGSFGDTAQQTNLRGYKVHIYTHGGTLTSNKAISVSSDRNVKENIKTLDRRYEDFFMDLSAVSYKYINNKFGRTHLGFIAQDVEQALLKNNLTTQEFAGVVIDENFVDPEDVARSNTPQKRYFLRYEEFISLNTQMIQKALKQIKETKAENAKLKYEMEQLNSKLNAYINNEMEMKKLWQI